MNLTRVACRNLRSCGLGGYVSLGSVGYDQDYDPSNQEQTEGQKSHESIRMPGQGPACGCHELH